MQEASPAVSWSSALPWLSLGGIATDALARIGSRGSWGDHRRVNRSIDRLRGCSGCGMYSRHPNPTLAPRLTTPSAQRSGDLPVVSERIDDAPETPSMGVSNRCDLCGARGHGLGAHRRGVFH